MLSAHSDAAPESKYTSSERTEIVRLDSVFESCVGNAASVFMKIDTQGYEWQVIESARQSIERVKAIQMAPSPPLL